jgi:hypothetical protein
LYAVGIPVLLWLYEHFIFRRRQAHPIAHKSSTGSAGATGHSPLPARSSRLLVAIARHARFCQIDTCGYDSHGLSF